MPNYFLQNEPVSVGDVVWFFDGTDNPVCAKVREIKCENCVGGPLQPHDQFALEFEDHLSRGDGGWAYAHECYVNKAALVTALVWQIESLAAFVMYAQNHAEIAPDDASVWS